MKKILTTTVIVLLALKCFCQEGEGDNYKTIFGNNHSYGGYGAFSMGYTMVNDRDAVTIGGRGAWIINHGLGLGFGGEGFISTVKYDARISNSANYVGGYGGMLVEPIILPKLPVHISIPLLFGAGGIAYASRNRYDNDYDSDSDDNYIEDSEGYFFVKPGAEIELNLTRFMRLSFGAYYMYTSKITIMGASNDALNGISGAITFKFGDF